MPVRVGWGDAEKSYIYLQLIGHWSWNDWNQALLDGRLLAQEAGRSVGLMANFADSFSLPTNSLMHYQRTMDHEFAVWRLIVLVSPNPLMRPIMRLFRPMYPRFQQRITVAATIQEARNILKYGARKPVANT